MFETEGRTGSLEDVGSNAGAASAADEIEGRGSRRRIAVVGRAVPGPRGALAWAPWLVLAVAAAAGAIVASSTTLVDRLRGRAGGRGDGARLASGRAAARGRSSRRSRATPSELTRAFSELEIAQAETVRRLSMAVEFRDEDTGAHIERIGRFSTLLAEHVGMDQDFCATLTHAAPLHDVGKVAIPDAILLKPGELTAEERAIVETHAEEGHRLLRGSSSSILDLAATIALSHHEKWDGSGYPRGVKGEAIPIEGRIVAVADVFDALTSDRVYRRAFTVEEAVEMMLEQRGRHFDPVLLDAFMEVLGRSGPDAREQLRGRPGGADGGHPRNLCDGAAARRRRDRRGRDRPGDRGWRAGGDGARRGDRTGAAAPGRAEGAGRARRERRAPGDGDRQARAGDAAPIHAERRGAGRRGAGANRPLGAGGRRSARHARARRRLTSATAIAAAPIRATRRHVGRRSSIDSRAWHTQAIVTGGAGFIGSHLVDALLAQGYGVTVIDDLSSGDRRRVAQAARLLELDIVDREGVAAVVEEVGPETVFHLAAQSSVVVSVENPGRDCEVNVGGTLNVVDAANKRGVPVVFTSTGGALYGDEAPRPTGEEHDPEAALALRRVEARGRVLRRDLVRAEGVANAVCRLGNVYGPRQSPHGEAGVVSIFTHRLHTGQAPKLFGHGEPTRDYVYVGDVVSALLAAAGRAGTFNIATGVETDVSTIWSELQQVAGSDLEPELADLRPGELQHSRLDASLAERELGWRAAGADRRGAAENV